MLQKFKNKQMELQSNIYEMGSKYFPDFLLKGIFMEDHLIFWNSSLRSTTEETNFYTEVLTEFELLLDGIP